MSNSTMDSGDDQSCHTASELLLSARCERAFYTASAQSGGHATAHSSWKRYQRSTLSYWYSTICVSGTSQNIISYTAPKNPLGYHEDQNRFKKKGQQTAHCRDKFNCQEFNCIPSCKYNPGKPTWNSWTRLFSPNRLSIWENMQQHT